MVSPSKSLLSEQVDHVVDNDRLVGIVRKFTDEPGIEFPWQGFAFDAIHPQTGNPCAGTMVGSFFGEEGRLDAIRAVLDFMEDEDEDEDKVTG